MTTNPYEPPTAGSSPSAAEEQPHGAATIIPRLDGTGPPTIIGPPMSHPVPPPTSPLPHPHPQPIEPIRPIRPIHFPPAEPIEPEPIEPIGVWPGPPRFPEPDPKPVKLPLTGPIADPIKHPLHPGPTPLGHAVGGGFQVHPQGLRTVSAHATQLGSDMLDTIGGSFGALSPVGQHTGWAVSGALSRCAQGWERELTNTSHAVHGIGDKLAASVEHYTAVDRAHRDHLHSIRPLTGQE